MQIINQLRREVEWQCWRNANTLTASGRIKPEGGMVRYEHPNNADKSYGIVIYIGQ
jgi:hypothetical protein